MAMTYELFVFDFDGTIADSRANIANSVNRALEAIGLDRISNDAIFPTIGKMSIQDVFRKFYPSLDVREVENLTLDFRNHLIINAKDELEFFPKVLSTLRALQDNNKQLAILTTKNTKTINEIIDILGIGPLFSVIYGSGLRGGDKPAKGCVEYIWEMLNQKVTPAETVMVGDTFVDLETAQNAGIDAIGVTYGIDGNEIKNLGFSYTIDNFDELLKFT